MAERLTIARPYAEAVFHRAQDNDVLQTWSDMLKLLAQIIADEQIGNLIKDPDLSHERLTGLIVNVCGEGINADGTNFLKLLLENDRLLLLPEISALFEKLKSDAEGTIEAHVVSAFALSEQQTKAISVALKARLGRDVTVSTEVDASLLGGAVIRAGDLIIDGSVSGYLQDMSSQLKG
jgi:F-type H+-transporting ATPase subunit delta